ncbi:MAG: asparagine synthetase B [Candidatus Tectimicrobiota bacterium]|nr:MAG: asparagine synthetase B [Candidatus Tectomicrobia bacterium]
MCGIVGIKYDAPAQPVCEDVIHQMCQAILHRGPDDEGLYVDGAVGLGMRRLSIIDLSTGRQPIHNEDRSLWVVFNGEIYNYRELRADLQARGHRFYTQSDTEVIVHLYEELGSECFTRLNGMFAIALWDSRRRQLVLARDRVGKKPLYYAHDGRRWLFASELKALLRVPGFAPAVNLHALDYFLTLGCVPGDLCIFQGVHKLPAGHVLLVTAQGARRFPYWEVSFAVPPVDAGEAAYLETLRTLLFDAVRLRLISDVPLGAFLSGGIDSSTVVAVMAHLGMGEVKTFSIGFDEAGYSELPYAREVATFLGTQHYELTVKPDMAKLLPELVWYFDEPFADSSAVPTYYVSQLARRYVTVVLSGDGGDELFAGYTRYFDPLPARLLQALPAALRVQGLHALARRLPAGMRGRRWLLHTSDRAAAYYATKLMTFDPERKQWLYTPELQAELDVQAPQRWLETYFDALPAATPTARRQYVDLKTYLTDVILTKVDRASMAVSLEARAPLLDYRLVEFAASLPDRYKVRGGQGKYLLKALARQLLPASIVTRRKKGFSIPKARWLRQELYDFCADILLSARARGRGYFRPSAVEALLQAHRRGSRDFSDQLWALLCLELWHRQFVDRVP